METVPAFHIAVFGVYPTRDIPVDVRESFTAAAATRNLQSLVTDNAMAEWQRESRFDAASPEMEAMGREMMQDNLEAISQASAVAKQRMELAYAMASRDGWIKPMMGMAIVGKPIIPDAIIDEQRQLLSTARKILHDYKDDQIRSGHYLFSGEGVGIKPISRLAHIRCIVRGQPVALTETGESLLFKSLDAPFVEPELKHLKLPLQPIDTYCYFSSFEYLRHSPEMGFGPGTP